MIENAQNLLDSHYDETCKRGCDIQPYQSLLSEFAQKCSHVTEMGIGPFHLGLNSTWCLLHGLSKSQFPNNQKKYISIDWDNANTNIIHAEEVSNSIGIDFKFIVANSIEIEIEKTDLLFIDTDHRYQHLMKELKMHSPNVSKYIVMHDTSGKYGEWEDWPYDHENRGELRNSPEKYGLWPCVVDFLKENTEWEISVRGQEGNGMTVIQRIIL
jgi:cephalosporin hydroxylase